MEEKLVSFEHFIERFPEVRLPVALTEESQRLFSATNEPFPQAIIEQYLLPLEGIEPDPYTEFVPCFRIPETYEFHAIVYWKAALLDYQFMLVTLTKQGEVIDKKAIAGTYYDGEMLLNSVATIDEDWEIIIVSGKSDPNGLYRAASSKTVKMEMLPEGQIITL